MAESSIVDHIGKQLSPCGRLTDVIRRDWHSGDQSPSVVNTLFIFPSLSHQETSVAAGTMQTNH